MTTTELLSVPAAHREAAASGVSWQAVIGGAFVTAALSLIMLALGAGFGLSAVSPWSHLGASAAAAGTVAILWLIVTQIIASSMGGYLAGRLRTKWSTIHGDEVHFRDTANGFLAWAVALVMTAAFLGAAAASMAGTVTASSEATKAGDGAASVPTGMSYFVDRLFRSDHPTVSEGDAILRAEASRAFVHELLPGGASAADSAYLAQLVAAKTGLSSSEANARVSETIAAAKQAEDDARKATAHLLLWLFLALLVGAFCASLAATFGGRQRDRVQFI